MVSWQVIRDIYNPRVIVEGRNMVWKHVKMEGSKGMRNVLLTPIPQGIRPAAISCCIKAEEFDVGSCLVSCWYVNRRRQS
jgi:hypothetical protein